jgi:hypothetical protein
VLNRFCKLCVGTLLLGAAVAGAPSVAEAIAAKRSRDGTLPKTAA